MKDILFLVLVVLFMNGCTTTHIPGSVRMAQPNIKVEKLPDYDFSKLGKFVVIPRGDLFEEMEGATIEEKQLLFILRNQIERLGYKYVSTREEADFVATIMSFENEYKQSYIPPSTYTTVKRIPGATETASVNSNSSFSGYYDSSFFSGSSYDSGTVTYRNPDQYVPVTNTIPGRYIGWYFPEVTIYMYDSASGINIWSGRGYASADEDDLRKTFSIIAARLLLGNGPLPSFPLIDAERAKEIVGDSETLKRFFGFHINIVTDDGNSFFPVVFAIAAKSPMDVAGIRVYDLITEINGSSTLNKSHAEVLEMAKGASSNLATFTILRNGKQLAFDVEAVPLENIGQEWSKWKGQDGSGGMATVKIQE